MREFLQAYEGDELIEEAGTLNRIAEAIAEKWWDRELPPKIDRVMHVQGDHSLDADPDTAEYLNHLISLEIKAIQASEPYVCNRS